MHLKVSSLSWNRQVGSEGTSSSSWRSDEQVRSPSGVAGVGAGLFSVQHRRQHRVTSGPRCGPGT